MQWLGIILSYLLGNFQKQSRGLKQSALEIFDEIVFKSRRAVTLLLVGLASVIFLCGGIFIALLQATTQYDRNGQIYFSSSIGAGLTLIVLSLIAFAIVFLRAWPGVHRQPHKAERPSSDSHSSLEYALSLLITDYTNERRERREARQQHREAKATRHRQRTNSSSESPITHH